MPLETALDNMDISVSLVTWLEDYGLKFVGRHGDDILKAEFPLVHKSPPLISLESPGLFC